MFPFVLPWVSEDIFFLSILMVRGEARLTRKKITSGHRSMQPHFHVRNQFGIWTGSPIGYSHVKLFDVVNQGHSYIVNSLRTWEYPIGDPVQIPNWFLTWKWGGVLLWPEVIFFLVNPASPRTISIDNKKIYSGTQGTFAPTFAPTFLLWKVFKGIPEIWDDQWSMVKYNIFALKTKS